MTAAKITDAEICALYQGGTSMHRIRASPVRIRRVLEENGIPIDLRRRYLDEVKAPTTPQPKPLTLERRPSVKQQPPGHWVDAVRAMTNHGEIPPPLSPKDAGRLRMKLYARRWMNGKDQA